MKSISESCSSDFTTNKPYLLAVMRFISSDKKVINERCADVVKASWKRFLDSIGDDDSGDGLSSPGLVRFGQPIGLTELSFI